MISTLLPARMMFPGFAAQDFAVNGTTIHAVHGGNRAGKPLLLLHGHPQTHAIWHLIAPRLAERFYVVAADLRGYGDSAKPQGLPDHSNYSKRVMAQDQVELMRALGFERFLLCAHDRGARVAHRLCLDHSAAVEKAVFLDIAPTLDMYEGTTMEFARAYWHWFYLIQPAPLPETMLGHDPEFYLRSVMARGEKGLGLFTPEAFAEYLRCAQLPGAIHAMCEDYRAAAGIDLEHDRQSRSAGHKVQCPLTVIWGQQGVIERCFEPLQLWGRCAETVGGQGFPCGHYIPEEAPELLLEAMLSFFG